MVEKTPSKGNNPSRRPRSEQKALTSRFKTASATAPFAGTLKPQEHRPTEPRAKFESNDNLAQEQTAAAVIGHSGGGSSQNQSKARVNREKSTESDRDALRQPKKGFWGGDSRRDRGGSGRMRARSRTPRQENAAETRKAGRRSTQPRDGRSGSFTGSSPSREVS